MSEQHPYPAGAEMLDSFRLASERGKVIEDRDARIEELEAEQRRLDAIVVRLDTEVADERDAHKATKAAAKVWGAEAADTYNTMVRERDVRITELEAKLDRWQEAMDERDAELAEERAAHVATEFNLASLDGECADLEQDRNIEKGLRGGGEMLLASEIEQHMLTRAELARVSADCSEKTARLRTLSSAYEAIMEEVRETVDALGVPRCGDLRQGLAWLHEQRFSAYEQLRKIDALLSPYMPATNAPTHLVARLEHVLAMLQKGKGGGG